MINADKARLIAYQSEHIEVDIGVGPMTAILYELAENEILHSALRGGKRCQLDLPAYIFGELPTENRGTAVRCMIDTLEYKGYYTFIHEETPQDFNDIQFQVKIAWE